METQHPDRQAEQEHLTQTLETVRSELKKTELALGMVDGNDRFIMVEDDASSDAIVAQQVVSARLRDLHQLRLSQRSPYFARLDFTPDAGAPMLTGMRAGEKTPVYIGRWGVIETPAYRVCVTDWRSPVANLYYSGQVGRVSYEAPDGRVQGDLSLKRMFTIADGALTGMQDTGVVGQEKFLTDALSQVTTSRLREVVTTIQAEQNTVIRYDPMRPLCVQGVAGSGKTTIALHRIAWILYRLQKTLSAKQMLILAPNPLFLSYISRVLPDLGVDEVRQLTFAQLCGLLMGKRMPRLHTTARLTERLSMTKAQRDALDDVLRAKGALSLADEIAAFLKAWETRMIPDRDVLLGKTAVITAEELRRYFMVEFRHFPLYARIGEVRKVVEKRLKTRLEKAREKLEKLVEDKLSALLRAMPDSPARRERATGLFAVRDTRLDELKALQKQFLKDYDALWGSTDLLTVYGVFWREKAERDPVFEPVWAATKPLLQKKRAAPEDLPALLLLARGLYGLTRVDVKHVVIDEAQDASPLQIKALREVFGHDAFTLVGDLCQGIYGDEGIRSWDDLACGIFAEPPTVAHLSTAYRSTIEIMELAFAILRRHPIRGAGEARPVLRHGEKPALLPIEKEADRVPAIAAQVNAWLAEGFSGIAVVVKTEKAAKKLHAALLPHLPTSRLVSRGDESFEGGVQVMDASVVKGLEFDCVLIADLDRATYPDEPFYTKLLYVLATRPLHRLAGAVAGDDPLSPRTAPLAAGFERD